MSKVAIITGTRKGLGRDLCLYYLEKGFIVAGCSRGEGSIDHPNYTHYALDVSEEIKAVGMIRDVYRKHGKIDILLNNAGIASMNPIPLNPSATAQRIMNTNFIGTFIFLREAGKIMLKGKKGRIVNFTTVATPLNLEGESLYAASKAAVESLTRIAAKEFGSSGITVNAVGPTPIPTDLIKNVPKEKMDALLEQQAIKRFGNINDLVNVIDFFIDDRSEFITGQVIYLGGVTK
ncbi:MAG: SDR family NAD(P)-dependent oxidoreductase [Bacteroidales bacterium]